MVAEMDRLLDDYNYAEVARILNENGFKTGDGLALDIDSRQLHPNSLWTQEPLRSAS
jgi:hypothetical protein